MIKEKTQAGRRSDRHRTSGVLGESRGENCGVKGRGRTKGERLGLLKRRGFSLPMPSSEVTDFFSQTTGHSPMSQNIEEIRLIYRDVRHLFCAMNGHQLAGPNKHTWMLS